jgi:energy-coupling factor transport system permease protein
MKRPHPLSLFLIVLWLTSMAIFVSVPMKLLILLLIAILGVLLFSDADPQGLTRGLKKLLPVLLVIFVIQILANHGGKTLLPLGFLSVTEAGLYKAVGLVLRILVIFIAAKILARMNYVEFDDAFRKLGFPDEAGFMIAHAAHLIPNISRELKAKKDLIIARGIDMKRLPLRDKVKIYKVIALDISGNLLRNVDQRSIALELRGFRSAGKSTRLRSIALGSTDALILLLLVAISMTLYVFG